MRDFQPQTPGEIFHPQTPGYGGSWEVHLPSLSKVSPISHYVPAQPFLFLCSHQVWADATGREGEAVGGDLQ